MHRVVAVALVVVGLGIGTLTAQGERVVFGRSTASSVAGSAFDGSADRHTIQGQAHVYEGNVTMTFPSSQTVIRANRAIWNWSANEITVDGNVRISLDSK